MLWTKRNLISAGLFVLQMGCLSLFLVPCQGQDLMSVRVAPTDFGGNPISTIDAESSFLLNVYTQDIRPVPQGVFSVYADVFYDTGLFEAVSIQSYSEEYSELTRGDLSIPGIIDEAGSLWDFIEFPNTPDGQEYLVMSIEMNSLQQNGTGAFSADPADVLPTHESTIFGLDSAVPPSQIQFIGSQLTVGSILACDADSDGDCDITDLNLLYAAFGSVSSLDLNNSGTVESGDIPEWLALASDPSNPAKLDAAHVYFNGDVNLDGSVLSDDLGVLLNKFGDGTGLRFADGNLNDDASVDSIDLGILLNGFSHTSLSALAVPEPHSRAVLLALLAGWICSRRRRD